MTNTNITKDKLQSQEDMITLPKFRAIVSVLREDKVVPKFIELARSGKMKNISIFRDELKRLGYSGELVANGVSLNAVYTDDLVVDENLKQKVKESKENVEQKGENSKGNSDISKAPVTDEPENVPLDHDNSHKTALNTPINPTAIRGRLSNVAKNTNKVDNTSRLKRR